MSIKQAHATGSTSITEKPTTQDTSSIHLPAFCCPRDGSLLEMEHKLPGGRFECYQCRSTWLPQEVVVE